MRRRIRSAGPASGSYGIVFDFDLAIHTERRRRRCSFRHFKNGNRVGDETWHVTRNDDGTLTNDFVTKLTLHDAPIAVQGRLSFDASASIRAASLSSNQNGDTATYELKSESTIADGGASTTRLAVTTQRAGKAPEHVIETQPSRIFLPQPSVAGFFSLCVRPPSESDTFVLFPGATVRVVSVSTKNPGVRSMVLDVASSLRIELACRGDRLAVLRSPMQSMVVVRDGEDALAAEMQAQTARTKPPIPDSLVEEDRTVDVPAKGTDVAATLSCSFLRPKSMAAKAKVPAVIFVTGSGPEDRDEDTTGPGGLKLGIFKTIAIRLAQANIASLRCDDRGTGKSTGTFSSATLDTFVRDARATLAALRTEPSVDASRVGLVGHSEGGVIGPRVAVEDKTLKALFLMAAPGEKMGDIGTKQIRRALVTSGAPDDEIARQIRESNVELDAILNGKPFPDSMTAAEKEALEKQRAWLRSELENDPIKIISRVKCPVFFAQGAKDEQVPPEDAGFLLAAIQKSGNAHAEAKTYPGLNHLFATTLTGSMADYSDPASKLSDDLLTDASSFFVEDAGTVKRRPQCAEAAFVLTFGLLYPAHSSPGC